MYAHEHVMLAGLCANDRALQHAETGRRFGVKSRRYRHLDENIFARGDALQSDERSAGAYIYGGAKLKRIVSFRVGAVDKNRECQGNALPTSGLVLYLGHDLDFLRQG